MHVKIVTSLEHEYALSFINPCEFAKNVFFSFKTPAALFM